jgi:hypothetical protein
MDPDTNTLHLVLRVPLHKFHAPICISQRGYNNAPLLDATCGCRCARLISNEKWVENETHLPIQGYIVLFRLSKAKSIIENASAPALLSVVIGKTLTPFGTLLFKWISNAPSAQPISRVFPLASERVCECVPMQLFYCEMMEIV